MRNLVDRVKRGVAVGLLSITLALAGGCGSKRIGDKRVSWWPILGGKAIKYEVYRSETSNEVIGTQQIEATELLGNVHMDMRYYGKNNKLKGRYKVKYEDVRSEYPEISTEIYDSSGRKIKTIDGVPDDLPAGVGIPKGMRDY